MRYLIVGAGAVGGTIGARLAASSHDVVLVARGEHRRVLAAEGLRLRTPAGTEVWRLPVVGSPDELELRPDDVLVLAVKTQHTAAALRDWAAVPVLGGRTAAEDLPVLCAQNGVANERMAARSFAAVLGACVWLPAAHLSPGEVVASAAPLSGILQIGDYPSGAGAVAARIAADFTGPHLAGRVREDVMRWKHGKLLRNLGNALDAVCPVDSDTGDLYAAALAEGQSVLDAHGITYTDPEEERVDRGDDTQQQPVAGWDRRGSSTWQSLERGSDSTEVEYLNGEVVLLGRQAGVPTPVNAALVAAVATLVRAGAGPRMLDPGVLRVTTSTGGRTP
jgi:2-dehydropantoate 2-reductase